MVCLWEILHFCPILHSLHWHLSNSINSMFSSHFSIRACSLFIFLQAHVFLLLISAKLRVLFTELFQILHFWANNSRLSSLVIIGLRVVVKLVVGGLVAKWWRCHLPWVCLSRCWLSALSHGFKFNRNHWGFLLVDSGIRANFHSTTMRPQPSQRAPHMTP